VLSFAGIGKTSSFAQSGNTIEMLKVDPVRKTLYVGPHIVDIEKNSVTGEIPGELGTVVEHVDVEGRRLYVSRFTEEEMIFQKTDELTVSDADTHELLDVIKLKRPSSVNVAVDSSLGIVISKPLVMGMPFFGEIDIHRIG
jgi:hypothetical protein